jgi:DNA modification methylase
MIKPVHPFPARMGPDLAVERIKRIKQPSLVLDPMAGSGTVLRHAAEFGHLAVGMDLDPLAILMAKVWTTPVDFGAIDRQFVKFMQIAKDASADCPLPWLDSDVETREFVDYWFAAPQCSDLRRIALGLQELSRQRLRAPARDALDVLRLALSRIIITKDSGASLARDVSHSRPHKVCESTTYQVFQGFELSVQQLRNRLAAQPPPGNVKVTRGDARRMANIENESVDVVLSSPPYLNAIDYMRGHRLSLVWLGYRLSELRDIRAMSVGTERGLDRARTGGLFDPILDSLGPVHRLPSGDRRMIERYAEDMYRLMSEIARVLKSDGRANLVVGNSNLRGVFIENSKGFSAAGRMVGLKVTRKVERNLPTRKRYLPIPKERNAPLGKRMRTETVLTFKHA